MDGTGSATITDLAIESVPNREKYEDVYPEDSEEEDADECDGDDDGSEAEPETVKTLVREKKENEDATKKASEDKASASSRLAMLENYARSMEKDRPQDLEACILTYSKERQKAYEVHFASDAKIKSLEKERTKISKKITKAMHDTRKEKAKAAKEKARSSEKKRRVKQEKIDARNRLKQERIEFWPRKVYSIVLSLDTNSDLTPASSRRGSIDSLAKTLSEESSSCQISLYISYITHSAWWSPRYDLSLNTPNSSGQIIYRAEFCNGTSEVWRDTKITLSTLQTSFQGISEPIPSMQPWHIRLSKHRFGGDSDTASGALFSSHEIEYKRKGQLSVSDKANEPRNALFGLGNSNVSNNLFGQLRNQRNMSHPSMPPPPQQMQQAQMQQAHQHQAQASSGFGSQNASQSNRVGSLFGSSNNNAPSGPSVFSNQNAIQSNSGPSLFGSSNSNVPSGPPAFSTFAASHRLAGNGETSEEEAEHEGAGETILGDLLGTQESEWTDTGMTATYDIPGIRTVHPSHTMRRHKIASIILKDVSLSYILVPKLRQAAFLKARIRNTSNIALLKGPSGLTVDGSFLGNTSLPHCSAGAPFSLNLGVDPSVNVAYSKPVVKRSQTGVFQKEGSSVYTRTITITNTKTNRPLEGILLDQIPVSEDERLKVDIIQPSVLRSEGDSAKSGAGVAAVGKVTEKWGSARATLKKAGEICWNIKIEPSRGVKLVLEYEAKFPSTEVVVGC